MILVCTAVGVKLIRKELEISKYLQYYFDFAFEKLHLKLFNFIRLAIYLEN